MQALAEEPADVVLLDLQMPEMDGWAFLAQRRESPALARIPVIVVTSSVLSEEERRLLHDVAAVLPKDRLSAAALDGAIRAALGAAVVVA